MDVIEPPKDVPLLVQRLAEKLTNHWNEFLSKHDPLQKPQLYKKLGLGGFLSVVLIAAVSSVKEYRKLAVDVSAGGLVSSIRRGWSVLSRELSRRGASVDTFVAAALITADPRYHIATVVKWTRRLVLLGLMSPLRVFAEVRSLLFHGRRIMDDHTLVGTVRDYAPLFWNAALEIAYYCRMGFHGPANILLEFLRADGDRPRNITLCGRKVVAWSVTVNRDKLRRMAEVTGTAETEVALAAAAGALCREPSVDGAFVTARHLRRDHFFLTGVKSFISLCICVKCGFQTTDRT